jgi:hypothetical protein
MNDNFKEILTREIPALEQEIANSPARREAIKRSGFFGMSRREGQEKNYLEALGFCLECCNRRLHVPETFMELQRDMQAQLGIEVDLCLRMEHIRERTRSEKRHLEEIGELRYGRGGTIVDIGREMTKEMEGLIHESVKPQFEAVRNIIFYRRTIALQHYVEKLKTVIRSVEPNGDNAHLASLIVTGCTKEARHRQPLNFLVAKRIMIEGDPYDDAISLLRAVCYAYGKISSQEDLESSEPTDPAVDQAFKRILETLSSQAQAHKKAEELAEKCRVLKAVFPEAQGQIDKLFRQEIDGLKR